MSNLIRRCLFAIIITIVVISLTACGVGNKYAEFAKCLTDNKVVMYGSFWCPHCNSMKNKFGPAVQYINYVECDEQGTDPQPELCAKKKIEYFPTFEFNDSSKLTGEISFEILSQKTGCPLPTTNK